MNRYKAFVLLVIAATALVGFDYNMNINVPASYKFNHPTVRVQAAGVAASTGTGTGTETKAGIFAEWLPSNYTANGAGTPAQLTDPISGNTLTTTADNQKPTASGAALYFDGTNNKMILTSLLGRDDTKPFGVVAKFYFTPITTTSEFLALRTSDGTYHTQFMVNTSNRLIAHTNYGNGPNHNAITTDPLSVYLMVYTKDVGSVKAKMWVKAGSSAWSAADEEGAANLLWPTISGCHVTLGALLWTDSNTYSYWSGDVYGIRLFNRLFTDADLAEISGWTW